MKKKLRILAAIALGAIYLSSRRKNEFSMDSQDEGTVRIKAYGAREGDWLISGSLEIKEGQCLKADYALTQGALTVILLPAGGLNGGSGIREIEEQLRDENGYELNFSGRGYDYFSLPADTYYVKTIASSRVTGETVLTVE